MPLSRYAEVNRPSVNLLIGSSGGLDDKKIPRKAKRATAPMRVGPDTLRLAIRRSLKKGLEEAQEAKQAVEVDGIKIFGHAEEIAFERRMLCQPETTRRPEDSARHLPQIWGKRFFNNLALGWIKGELRTARVNPEGKN